MLRLSVCAPSFAVVVRRLPLRQISTLLVVAPDHRRSTVFFLPLIPVGLNVVTTGAAGVVVVLLVDVVVLLVVVVGVTLVRNGPVFSYVRPGLRCELK